jgi:hypothetical protein
MESTLVGPDGGGDGVLLRTAAKRIGGTKSAKRDDADSNKQKGSFRGVGLKSGDAMDTCKRNSGSMAETVVEISQNHLRAVGSGNPDDRRLPGCDQLGRAQRL